MHPVWIAWNLICVSGSLSFDVINQHMLVTFNRFWIYSLRTSTLRRSSYSPFVESLGSVSRGPDIVLNNAQDFGGDRLTDFLSTPAESLSSEEIVGSLRNDGDLSGDSQNVEEDTRPQDPVAAAHGDLAKVPGGCYGTFFSLSEHGPPGGHSNMTFILHSVLCLEWWWILDLWGGSTYCRSLSCWKKVEHNMMSQEIVQCKDWTCDLWNKQRECWVSRCLFWHLVRLSTDTGLDVNVKRSARTRPPTMSLSQGFTAAGGRAVHHTVGAIGRPVSSTHAIKGTTCGPNCESSLTRRHSSRLKWLQRWLLYFIAVRKLSEVKIECDSSESFSFSRTMAGGGPAGVAVGAAVAVLGLVTAVVNSGQSSQVHIYW